MKNKKNILLIITIITLVGWGIVTTLKVDSKNKENIQLIKSVKKYEVKLNKCTTKSNEKDKVIEKKDKEIEELKKQNQEKDNKIIEQEKKINTLQSENANLRKK